MKNVSSMEPQNISPEQKIAMEQNMKQNNAIDNAIEKRMAYVNGEYVSADAARISPLDRGFLLGDGVYEVVPLYYRKLFHLKGHIDRLNQSLKGIRMEPPLSLEEWHQILMTLTEKNPEEHQWLYLQVTRGVSPRRSHEFPLNTKPGIFAISYPNSILSKAELSKGIKTLGVKDIRWQYCHIKTISRIAYVLMHQEAIDAGCSEAIVLHDGFALEGTTSNLFIVQNGVIITPPKSNQLLSGITRDCILSLAKNNKIPYREAEIRESDLLKADELWISSSTRGIHAVTEFNGQPVGGGKSGPVFEKVLDLFLEEIKQIVAT